MAPLKYWIWLSSLHGLRPKARELLLEHFGSPKEIYFAADTDYRDVGGIMPKELETLKNKDMEPALDILDKCREGKIRILTMQDAEYPRRLLNIFDPPAVLYVKGNLPVIDEEAAIGIAGTRKASPYGIKMARRMGYEITKGGGLVVSGLAEGIDSAGAHGALRAGGSCVGVLGTAIDQVYPRFNWRLFEDVMTVGALVSEYPPGAPNMPGNFPQRNRIISGLCVGVVIIEAPAKSGALITASRALDYGRDVFAVPGNADSFNCVGSNELIKDCAKAVTSGWDVLCEYEGIFAGKIHKIGRGDAAIPQEEEPEKPSDAEESAQEVGVGFAKLRVPTAKKEIDKQNDMSYIDLEAQLKELSENQLKIVSVMTAASMHVDDIIDLSGLPASVVLSELTLLQIKGYVIQERGKRFSLNIKKN
ncbi:MAG TPA: DNA-protecting protein DprA [Clostridiales bacterium]|nr:DNA-protecting protein DprA [Clostridiales bacterium]